MTLLVLLLLVGVLWGCSRQRVQLTAHRNHPELSALGQPFEVTLQVQISAPWPCRLHLSDPPPRTLIPAGLLEWRGLIWGKQEVTLQGTVRPQKRGEFIWEGASLQLSDPFGLFWRTLTVPVCSQVVVYPHTHPLLLPELVRPLLLDGRHSPTLGLEDVASLRGIREYQPGDPINRLHWLQTARRGTPMVREWEFMTTSYLHLHLHPEIREVFTESAVVLASSLVLEALQNGLTVSVSGNGLSSDATPESSLWFLARYQPQPEQTGVPEVRVGSNVIMLSQTAPLSLLEAAVQARTRAARVTLLVLPEGFYLAPGETGRKQWARPPEQVQELERKAAILLEQGIEVVVLRGNESILQVAETDPSGGGL